VGGLRAALARNPMGTSSAARTTEKENQKGFLPDVPTGTSPAARASNFTGPFFGRQTLETISEPNHRMPAVWCSYSRPLPKAASHQQIAAGDRGKVFEGF